MRTFFILLMIQLLPMGVYAQQLKETGASPDDLVPEGFWSTMAQGDLNKDGIADLAIIAISNDKENLKVREDGYVYNFNQPILAIYMGQREGGYKMWKQYKDILSKRNETTSIDHSLNITDRGVLQINISEFHTAGGWSEPSATYVLRLQNGDFFLIGKDTDSFARNTGEGEKVSCNYLTRKCQTITYNAMDDSVKPIEKWSKLPNKKLEVLGSFTLEAY